MQDIGVDECEICYYLPGHEGASDLVQIPASELARRIRQTRRRAHWCVYQPAPPRVAWWAVQRVALATDAPQVIKFAGLELRSGDTFTLPQITED